MGWWGSLGGGGEREREGGRERRDFLKRYEVGRQTMEVNQSVSPSRFSPLCSEDGQASSSLFSLHSHHAGLYFYDYRSTNSPEDYYNM